MEAMTDPTLYGTDAVVRALLADTETWIIVGLSANQQRAAYSVAQFLQRNGKRIVPVHPRADDVLGEAGYATIAEAVAGVGPIDVVDVFVNSTRAGDVAREAIASQPKGVWFQLDVIDEDAAAEVVAAGIDMVMDRCPVIEWPRLGLGA
jgi:predicted CoA-binding protein